MITPLVTELIKGGSSYKFLRKSKGVTFSHQSVSYFPQLTNKYHKKIAKAEPV